LAAGLGGFTGEFSSVLRDNSYVDNLPLVQFVPFGVMGWRKRAIPAHSEKSVLMRKTIVINTLLILGYYVVLQLLIWVSMVLR